MKTPCEFTKDKSIFFFEVKVKVDTMQNSHYLMKISTYVTRKKRFKLRNIRQYKCVGLYRLQNKRENET
jgi:hypothetical protein